MRLRVVSWNLHGCVGTDCRFDPRRTADALGALAPDRALARGRRQPRDPSARRPGRHAGPHPRLSCAIGLTLRSSRHGYGNATLTRLPVLDTESIDLSVHGREPRIGLRVVVGRDAFRLTTFNVHLGLGPGERRRQLRKLLPSLDARPLVIGGDFNDFPPGPVTLTFKNHLLDTGARLPHSRTFPSYYPLRLDRIYVSPATHVLSARVERSATSAVASDHSLVVDLELA